MNLRRAQGVLAAAKGFTPELVVGVWAGNDDNTMVMPNPNMGYGQSSKNHRPGQKLEPFWISMIAEADRAVWDDQFKANNGMDALAMFKGKLSE